MMSLSKKTNHRVYHLCHILKEYSTLTDESAVSFHQAVSVAFSLKEINHLIHVMSTIFVFSPVVVTPKSLTHRVCKGKILCNWVM